MTATASLASIPDLTDPATFAQAVPHDAFDLLRSRAGLAWHPAEYGTRTGGFWVMTRYDEIVEVLQQPDVFLSNPGPTYPLANISGDGPMSKHILFMDPPEHGRVRRAAARSFGPRIVANFEHWIRDVIVETLDDAIALDRFDWVQEVARLVPSRVIASIMGVPRDERGFIVDSADEIFAAQTLDDGGASFGAAFLKVGAYCMDLGERKLAAPQDDMLTVLARARQAGEIDAAEFQLYSAGLVVAGFETTHTMIGHIAHLLADNPDIQSVANRAIAENKTDRLVNEFVRYVTPVMNFTRTANRDLTFRGQEIKKDDTMFMSFVAANRDPAAFTDPHRFDPFRAGPMPAVGLEGAGLSFSAGPHRCLGHVIARLELRILLEELYKRGISLALDGVPRRGWSTFANQLLSLPVRVTVAS